MIEETINSLGDLSSKPKNENIKENKSMVYDEQWVMLNKNLDRNSDRKYFLKIAFKNINHSFFFLN